MLALKWHTWMHGRVNALYGIYIGECIDFLMSFLKDFDLFLEREEGKEKERERNINVWWPLTCPLLGTWPTTQACALTGN